MRRRISQRQKEKQNPPEDVGATADQNSENHVKRKVSFMEGKIHCRSIESRPFEVIDTGTGPAFAFVGPGGWEVELTRKAGWDGLRVCPAAAVGCREIDGEVLRLACDRSVLLEVNNRTECYVLSTPLPEPPPKASGRLVHFRAGLPVEAGTIELGSGDVLWIEPGARVRGHVVAADAVGVRIGGGGVLDASYAHPSGEGVRGIVLDGCRDAVIDNLTITHGRHWMISVGNCEDVEIRNTRQFSTGGGTDGIDIVGSRRISVRDCFLRNGDDNFAIKALNVKAGAFPGQSSAGNFRGNWDAPVSEILIERCAIYNDHGGTAMEIGYETRTEKISGVTFRDIDVMGVHQFGSVFGIHNGDRALVENILWEDIRVEHHYDKLVDFRILHSRWNTDAERGLVRGVTLRRVRVGESIYNTGYTVSLIGGFDAAHPVGDVCFEDFQLGGRVVRSGDEVSLFTKHAGNISFLTSNGKSR